MTPGDALIVDLVVRMYMALALIGFVACVVIGWWEHELGRFITRVLARLRRAGVL